MADPLSIVASAIALGSAVGATKKGLDKIKDLFNANDELLALINEITNIQLIVANISEETELRLEYFSLPQQSINTLVTLLNQLKDEVSKLEHLVHYRLISGYKENGQVKAEKITWAREQPNIKSIRDKLRSLRLDLVSQLSAVAITDLSDLRLKMDRLVLVANKHSTAQALFEDRALRAFDQHADNLNNIGTSILTMQQSSTILATANPHPLPSSAQTIGDEGTRTTEPDTQEGQLTLGLSFSRSSRSTCNSWCSCVCHIRHSFSFLSTLFVGYSGVPFFTASCNQRACLRRSRSSLRFTFYFPSWFLTRAILANVAYSPQSGPEFLLRVPRIIPPRSDIFRYAETGNIEGIKRLFHLGLASVHDLDMSGSTVLHFALNTSQYQVCKLLLDAGADPETEGPQDRKPVDIAWDSILAKYETGKRATNTASLFRNDDHIESRGFSLLHKCILDILQLNLEQLLKASTAEIDDVDADGRTSLIWAAIRGDEVNVGLLLKFGADPNKCDRLRKSPLHHARNAACTKLLLEAKKNVGLRDVYGRTALHAACRRLGDRERALELLQAGADVNMVDNWSRTPLSYLAQYNGAETAQLLFEQRREEIDVDIADVDGYTPIFTAVEVNSHQTLEVLLKRVSDQSLLQCTQSKGNLLHVAMRSADTETLLALGSHPSLDVFSATALYQVDTDENTVLGVRNHRSGMSTALKSAMDALLTKVQNRGVALSNLVVRQNTTIPSGEETFFDVNEFL